MPPVPDVGRADEVELPDVLAQSRPYGEAVVLHDHHIVRRKTPMQPAVAVHTHGVEVSRLQSRLDLHFDDANLTRHQCFKALVHPVGDDHRAHLSAMAPGLQHSAFQRIQVGAIGVIRPEIVGQQRHPRIPSGPFPDQTILPEPGDAPCRKHVLPGLPVAEVGTGQDKT